MKKYAFLAGVEEYPSSEVNTLEFAVNDVVEIGRILEKSCGFESPVVLKNPTDLKFMEELDDLAPEIREEDLFFFLFTGHGIERDGEVCLLANNANPRMDLGLIRLARLQEYLARIRASQRMLFLDCCRTNPDTDKGALDNVMTDLFSRNIDFALGSCGENQITMLLKACKTGQRAYEWGKKRHGVFSWYLGKGLSGEAWENGELSGRKLCGFVKNNVVEWGRAKNREQQPDFVQLEDPADIILVAAEKQPPPGELVFCPHCGKYNTVAETFHCNGCNKDYFCTIHRNAAGLCPSCAKPGFPWGKVLIGGLLAAITLTGAGIGLFPELLKPFSREHRPQQKTELTPAPPPAVEKKQVKSIQQQPVKAVTPKKPEPAKPLPSLAAMTAGLDHGICSGNFTTVLQSVRSKIKNRKIEAKKGDLTAYITRYQQLCSPQAAGYSGPLFGGAGWYLPEQQDGGLLVAEDGTITDGRSFIQRLLPLFTDKDKQLCTVKPRQLFTLLVSMEQQGGLSFAPDFRDKASRQYNAICGRSVAWYQGLDANYNGSAEELFYYPQTDNGGEFINAAGKRVATGESFLKGLPQAAGSGAICASNEDSLLKLLYFINKSGKAKLPDDFFARLSSNYAARCGNKR